MEKVRPSLPGVAWRRLGRPLRWTLLPSLAACLLAPSVPAAARTALPAERALLGLALALSLSHIAAHNAAAQGAPAAPAGDAVGGAVIQAQSEAPVPPTGDSGAGSRGPVGQGGPNGPDDRNLGSGGPVGGTEPAPSGAVQDSGQGSGAVGSSGAGDRGKSSGDESGSGSESNGGNQRSPAPIQ